MKRIFLGFACVFLSASTLVSQSLQVGRPAVKNIKPAIAGPGKTFSGEEIKRNINSYLRNAVVSESAENLSMWQPKISDAFFNNAGETNKIYLPDRNVLLPLRMTPRAVSADGFSESWESYDGSSKNWIPQNWSKKSNGEVQPADVKNKTWYVRGNGPVKPSEGNYMAWINFDATRQQNEWLISPSFRVENDDMLSFDLYYSPFYMYYRYFTAKTNTWEFDFNNPKATMLVYVSTDNGASWSLLWDLHSLAGTYNTNNIHSYTGAWYSYKISLSQYANRNIQIAYCYVGKNGDSMALDNIGIKKSEPQAFYLRPAGYFYAGLSKNYYSLTNDLLLGHAYHDATWRNMSNEESRRFTWTFPSPQGSGVLTSNDVNPVVNYPVGTFTVPDLKAEAGSLSSVYTWGSTKPSYFKAGGDMVANTGTELIPFGLGNYYIENGIVIQQNDLNGFAFGTTMDNSIDGIANFFEKPEVPYVINDLWISLGLFSAPDNKQFDLIIHRVVNTPEGMLLGDTIATAICKASEVGEPMDKENNVLYSMPFDNLKMYDKEIGLYHYGPVEIKDAILIEVKGFNNDPSVNFAVLSEPFNSSPESNAYVFQNYNGGRRLTRYMGNTSLLFNLRMMYTYFLSDSNTFEVPASGGNKVFNIQTNMPSDLWWLEEELPDWLTESYTYNTQTGTGTLTLKAQALPQGVESRTANLNLQTYGSGVTINITQNK